MKIIVSGGTGFLGSSLAQSLSVAGHEVHTIGRKPANTTASKKLIHHTWDLSKEVLPLSILSGTDVFFHIAAKAGVWGKYSEFYNANVVATEKILLACQSTKIPRLIYTSTPSVVFSEKSILGGSESLPYGNTGFSPYAETKAIAEQAVLNSHSPGKIQTVALRPHLVWGKDDPHLLPRVIARHKNGKLRIIGSGQNQVDLTHIDNVTHAHVCAMHEMIKNKTLGGKPYFIGQSEPVFLWRWLNQIFQTIDLPPLTKTMSFRNAYLLGCTMEKIWNVLRIKKEPPMTRFVACQLAHDHWFSNQSAEQDLGYIPIKNMADALEETKSWLSSL